jgi:hypothetical protein
VFLEINDLEDYLFLIINLVSIPVAVSQAEVGSISYPSATSVLMALMVMSPLSSWLAVLNFLNDQAPEDQ